MGGFERPNSGILLVLPVAKARGLRKELPAVPEKVLPHPVCLGWRKMQVGGIAHTAGLELVTAPLNAPLDEEVRALAAPFRRPGHLVELPDIRTIVEDLLFYTLPE